MEMISEPDPDDEGTKISGEKGDNQGNQRRCIIRAKVLPFLLQNDCAPFHPRSAAPRVFPASLPVQPWQREEQKCHNMEASLFGSIQISQFKATWSPKSWDVELEETSEAPGWMLTVP
ncbi:hypothetical protein D4764_17G0009060 [Takifugu flavidus]|uniref:Uncharacterized protein n=1 Tax=Takifugu flavidus TaxID=433684 RepID=A0A5C6NVV5_9TELE|nr:hypothetical protein D4764_17G0009060 [Takifugu flavidus]